MYTLENKENFPKNSKIYKKNPKKGITKVSYKNKSKKPSYERIMSSRLIR